MQGGHDILEMYRKFNPHGRFRTDNRIYTSPPLPKLPCDFKPYSSRSEKLEKFLFFLFIFSSYCSTYIYVVNSWLIHSRYHPWASVGHCIRYNPITNEKKCFPYETIGNQGRCRNNSLSISWDGSCISDQVQYSKFQTFSMLEVKFQLIKVCIFYQFKIFKIDDFYNPIQAQVLQDTEAGQHAQQMISCKKLKRLEENDWSADLQLSLLCHNKDSNWIGRNNNNQQQSTKEIDTILSLSSCSS